MDSSTSSIHGDDTLPSGGDTPTGEYKWFMLCGDPLCSEGAGHHEHPGVPTCKDNEGDPCAINGAICDPLDPCNANMQCAKVDPKPAGGCAMLGSGH